MGFRDLLARLPLFPNGVTYLRQTRPENCVQTVVAMAVDVPVETIEEVAGTEGRLTVRETFALLGRLGISVRPLNARFAADFWSVFYERNGGRRLRGLGFALPAQGEPVGHAYFLAGREMYDPATGDRERLDEEALRDLDWIAVFPRDLVDNPQLEQLRRALGRGA